MADLIRVAKEKPGTLNYSSGGIGNFSHMGLELLAHQTGIKLVHVPYRGVGPATQAILDRRGAASLQQRRDLAAST